MGGNHFVRADGNDLALVFDKRDHDRQTIEFCEIFLFDFKLLAVEFDSAVDVLSCFDEYFFVLPGEHVRHIFNVTDVLWSGGG